MPFSLSLELNHFIFQLPLCTLTLERRNMEMGRHIEILWDASLNLFLFLVSISCGYISFVVFWDKKDILDYGSLLFYNTNSSKMLTITKLDQSPQH